MNTVNTGDTAWVLASSALVMLMTPGLAFFLRRHGTSKECVGDFDAVLYDPLCGEFTMGSFWL